jgi:hypothetical protein
LHKRLQDQHGGDAIDFAFAGEAVFAVAGIVEYAVSLSASEALVPEVDGKTEPRAEFLSEGGDFLRLRPGLARHIQRIAKNDLCDGVLLNQVPEFSEVGAFRGAVKGLKGLRGYAKRVGDGQTDATSAEIERE